MPSFFDQLTLSRRELAALEAKEKAEEAALSPEIRELRAIRAQLGKKSYVEQVVTTWGYLALLVFVGFAAVAIWAIATTPPH